MLETLRQWHSTLNGWVWGPVTMALLMGTGLYLTILTRGVQFRWLGKALGEVLNKLHNKVELGLQVLWDRGKAVQDAEREVEELIRGAIEMHLEGMREDGEPIPTPTTWAEVVSL